MTKPKPKQGEKRGPKAETLQISGNWKAAVSKALARGKPSKASKKQRRSK